MKFDAMDVRIAEETYAVDGWEVDEDSSWDSRTTLAIAFGLGRVHLIMQECRRDLGNSETATSTATLRLGKWGAVRLALRVYVAALRA